MSDKLNPLTEAGLRELDASYKSFPTFETWAKSTIDLRRWNTYTQQLAELKRTSPEILKDAQDIVERAAAVDTGAIEGLYETNRGFTFTVAREATLWEITVQKEKGDKVLGYIKAQLEAYEYILDLATQKTPLSERSIREIHEVMCKSQESYTAYTLVGPQQRPLAKGQYKTDPNHVYGRDEKYHAYAPVEATPIEMHRLVRELQSEAFLKAHPVLQASYAHYAFVLIHPFSDGNGRVARAIASIYTYRDQSIPILILNEKRDEYLNALAEADTGNFQPFVDFILERTLDSIQLFNDSIYAAKVGSSNETLKRLFSLTRTKGGYTHDEVNKAGIDLFALLQKTFDIEGRKEVEQSYDILEFQMSMSGGAITSINPDYRAISKNMNLQSTFFTKSLLSNVEVVYTFDVIVPKDSDTDDDLIIRQRNTKSEIASAFSVRASEIIPQISGVTQMRLSILVQGIIREMLAELEQKARQSLGRT